MIRRMWLPLTALVLAFSLRAWDPILLQSFRNDYFDLYQRTQPRDYQAAPVLVIDIDDASMAQVGQWPWPRFIFADLVNVLTENGAASIGFDVMFSEPDRTSPVQVSKLWPSQGLTGAAADVIAQLPDHDEIFAEAMSRSNVVLGTAFTNVEGGREPTRKSGIAFGGTDPVRFAPKFSGSVSNLEIYEEVAAGNGGLTIAPEIDGTIRRVPLVFSNRGKIFPSLAAEILRTAQGAKTIIVKASDASGSGNFGEATGITSVKIGHFEIPTTLDGSVLLHFSGPSESRVLPAWKVLQGEFDRKDIEGKLIVVGSSAAGLKDLRATPLNPFEAGVNIQAEALEQIILGVQLNRPDWATGLELVGLLVLGLGLIISLQRFGIRLSAAVVFFFVSCLISASWFSYLNLRWLVDPIYVSLAGIGIFLAHSFQVYLETETEKREIRHAFSRYLSPHLVEQLAGHPEKLALGGEQKVLTLLFADIVGFTSMSEKFAPDALTNFMNRYLTPMTEIILRTGGTIDKYIGDSIMAFWNAPLDNEQHARSAIVAALAMHEDLKNLNRDLEREAKSGGYEYVPIRIGVGINTGEACVGNLGSDQRFDYSCLGDTVNIASRLEGQTRAYGFGTIIGEESEAGAPDFATVEIDLIRVKGKLQPLRIYSVLGDVAFAGTSTFQHLATQQAKALALYRAQDWSNAQEAFKVLARGHGPEFQVYAALMLERIAEYQKEPPPREWDGVFIATSK